MHPLKLPAPLALMTLVAAPLAQEAPPLEVPPLGLERWPVDAARAFAEREAALLAAVDSERLAAWHDAVASFPHVAGSEGDARLIALLAEELGALGLEVEVHPFVAYLASPVRAELRLLQPTEVELSVREAPLPGLPSTALADDDFGWNAYSGSGTVEGELVYANYGRAEDFAELARRGVDVTGRIVVARYGGNYRGFKARYAEAAGAAGLVIFTDPRDSGYGRGLAWPEGGWANDTCIQRGSILTLPWIGDPLTPGVEATEDAPRLAPEQVELPRIPVQPIGWAAALQLLAPMRGPSAPQEWQGGLPLRYRLTGGPDVRVRLTVQQERKLVRSANVLATLRGRDAGGPGEPFGPRVIVGSHHDAWGFGASDPTCGLIAVLEAARVFAADAQRSGPLRRSITFAAFGAEEFGIIGSTEYVEARRAELERDGVLYVNLDAAAGGLVFSAAATPDVRGLALDAFEVVRQPRRAPTAPLGPPAALAPVEYVGTVRAAFAPGVPAAAGAALLAPFGELGGGSDHAAFVALAAVPGVNLSAHGAEGTAYHSVYDDLAWYRATVGADYASARLITEASIALLARAAEAPFAPIELSLAPALAARHLAVLDPGHSLCAAFEELAAKAAAVDAALSAEGPRLAAIEGHRRNLDELLQQWPKVWLDSAGLPERPWFQNLYVAPDETSGYASWTLPGLRKALAVGDAERVEYERGRLLGVLLRMEALLTRLTATLAEGE